MYDLFDILERHGVVGIQELDKISLLPAKKLEKFYHETYNKVYDSQTARIWDENSPPPTDAFSFHASASIRGASGCLPRESP